MTIERKDIEALIRIFERSDWDELRLEVDGLKLVLSSDPDAKPLQTVAAGKAAAPARARAAKPGSRKAPAQKKEQAKKAEAPDGHVAITAPNLGTFYRAPKPGAAPYVDIGAVVNEDTEVCLIEVMKLFTPVKAGLRGKVVDVCVEDGRMVEFGEPLFFVEPAGGSAD